MTRIKGTLREDVVIFGSILPRMIYISEKKNTEK